MRVKSQTRRSAPETTQYYHSQIRRIIADSAENRLMKWMPPLYRSQIEVFPDIFENFAV
jgi:hypothetical protein